VAAAAQRQRELEGRVVGEVRNGDADERQAVALDLGRAAASRPRAVARIASVRAVGPGSVYERVAREKSSNRSLRITVPTRRAFRIRRVTRSTMPTRTASTSFAVRRLQPVAHCEPIEQRPALLNRRRALLSRRRDRRRG
jgi:hypothetical protein